MSLSVPLGMRVRECPLMTGARPPAKTLAWVDAFWTEAGRRVFAREEDSVLILPPNRVYRCNATAVSLVRYLGGGGRIADLRFPSAQAEEDTGAFFEDLSSLYRGELPTRGTVDSVSYDFSFTRYPVLAELAVTYRCNNACLFCYAGCGSLEGGANPVPDPQQLRPELDSPSLEKVLDIFAQEAKVPFFSFTGGEPLLRDDIERLTRHAHRLGLAVNLVSNGTLVDRRRATALKRAGLGSAQISIEGPDSATHDSLVARPGAFAETVSGIQALSAAGVPTQTNTTITAFNLPRIAEMPSFLASLGIRRFAMNLYIPSIPSPQASRLFVPYSEVGEVVEDVRAKAREAGLVFYWYSPTPFCLYNPIARGLGNKSCAAADGLLSVAPDGEVLPCSSWDEGLGNLLSQGFSSVWFSPRAAALKAKTEAPASCKSCASFTACGGACPLYWRFAGTGELQRRTP